MATLRHIAPASAFKIGLIAYGIVGFVLGVFCSAIAVAGVHFSHHAHMPFGRFGVLAVVMCPIIYGIIGGVGAVIGALIYNLAAKWVGGLEVEIG